MSAVSPPEAISRPYIHMESSSVLELSENVILNCSHDNGTRTTYKWFKGGKPLANMTRFVLSPDNKLLTITRVLMADDDVYSCSVENPVGNMTSLPLRLSVYSESHIIIVINKQKIGGKIQLEAFLMQKALLLFLKSYRCGMINGKLSTNLGESSSLLSWFCSS